MDEPEPSPATAPHPEEMTFSFDVHIGERQVVQARARTTPAGLVATSILVSSILLSTAVLIRAARRLVR